jgi:hypothetical protein
VFALERATSHSITVRPATLRLGGGENSVSLYIYHGPSHACSREGRDRQLSPSGREPAHLGGGENFLSPIVSRSKPCLLFGVAIIYHCPITTRLEEEKKLLFLLFSSYLPPYNQVHCLPKSVHLSLFGVWPSSQRSRSNNVRSRVI